MGLFDSVFVKCPKCGSDVEFQSKAGNCTLKSFNAAQVPAAIASDLAGDTSECECGAVFSIHTVNPVPTVEMFIREVK